MKEGSILVDHTVSKPDLAIRIQKEAIKKNIQTLDASVWGGDVGAINKKLVTMVGGEPEAFEKVLRLAF